MTIQLLREWNGNRVGIYTWDSGEESRLIGLGLARAWVPGIDGEARLTDSEVTKYTAAQLSAMAAAGTLTPYETYIASDDPYPQWALDAYTLGSPLGGNYVNVQVATAGGGTIEV